MAAGTTPYYVRSLATGTADGSSWANAYTTLGAATAARNVAGNTFYVSEDHNEANTAATTITVTGGSVTPSYVICVNHNGSVPPVSADMTTGAIVSTSGAYALTVSCGGSYHYGMTYQSGSGATGVVLTVNGLATMVNCSLQKLGTTATTSAITLGNAPLTLINTTMVFGNIGDSLNAGSVSLSWKFTPNAVQGTIPTTLTSSYVRLLIEGVDFSMFGTGKTVVGSGQSVQAGGAVLIKDCPIGVGGSIAAAPYNLSLQTIAISRCDSSGTNYREARKHYNGNQTDELVIVRTGGCSDGYTPKSRNLTSFSTNSWVLPLEGLPVSAWNDTTNSITATMYGICFGRTAVPTNDQVWFELQYLGSASSTLGSVVSGGKSDTLAVGIPLSPSTQAWDSLSTLRANSTAVTVGTTVKVASAPGQLFRCTTAGTTASTVPSGYSNIADGASINDGTAVFQAAMRFQQTLTFTAGQKGMVYATPKVAQVSTTFYIDPVINLV